MLGAGETGHARSIGPVPRTGSLPLSFAQQRLWFLDRLLPDKATYNIASVWRLQGQLDALALEHSLNELVARHETLRTRFVLSGDEPMQVIGPPNAVALPITDLSALPQAEREARARQITDTEARQPFDLEAGPLLRAQLLRLTAEEHLLVFNVHHIAFDGWSIGVLCRELSSGYNAFVSGHAPDLPRLPVQYVDYAVWQREWLQGEVLKRQLAYWKEKLADLSTLDLPTDRPRPPVPSNQGAQLTFELPAPLTQALKELSRREGVTLFMMLLAAFQVLLHRYSGQEDIAIGTPIAGRGRTELEGLTGFFVNTLVLRSNLAGNPTFTELLARVRKTALSAYAHQDLPFEKLVEELSPTRDISRNPVFQVMFVLQNTPESALTLKGVRASRAPVAERNAKFDLTLSVAETAVGLRATWAYSTDLFDASTIERMTRHFKTLLEGIIANADQRIGQLPLLTTAEHHQLLVEWNQTEVDYPHEKSIHQLFEEQVERTPNAVALVFKDRRLSYAKLNAQSNQLARYLQRYGVKRGCFVASRMERSADLIVTLLAALKAGGAYVALDPNDPSRRLHSILENARPVVLVVKSQGEKAAIDSMRLAEGGRIESLTTVICLDDHAQSISNESEENLNSKMTSEDQAYVCFTSGSSGIPKGIIIPHRAVVRLVKNTNYISLSSSDVFLQCALPSFDASTFEIWGCLLNGGQLVVPSPGMLSLAQIGSLIQKHNVSVLWLTAGLFHQMIDHELESLSGVRQLLAGGDVLSIAHVRKALDRLGEGRLINGYGPTENTTFTCCHSVTQLSAEEHSVPIGRPISNTQCFILDRNLQPVPIGVRGELFAGGDGLARGYLNDPELTAEKFISNPFRAGSLLYRTGDFACYRSDGSIEFLGRIDNQVKRRGYRIELGEIETVLKRHAAASEAVVVAREDVPGDRRLVAYVAPASAAAQVGELRGFLKERLPPYMLPSAFVFVDTFPLTPNGKLDRKALPVPERRSPELDASYVAPRTPTEEAVASIWCELFDLKQVGIYDNFFELGGHSLLAVRLRFQIQRALNIELPLVAIYRWPTIEGIALTVLQRQIEALGAKEAEDLFAEMKGVLAG
jgi:amino acid adenylation domain-containing protein